MFLEFFIAFRYLVAKRKQIFISLITFISIGGVAVGVAALIVVMAVMSGFESELKSRILGNNAHVVVMRYGGAVANYHQVMAQAATVAGVQDVAPFILNQVMIAHGRTVSGVVFRGIDPDRDPMGMSLRSHLTAGSFLDGGNDAAASAKAYPAIVVGVELAKNLGVSVGGLVRVISPVGSPTPLGMVPRMKLFQVEGIFSSGMYEYDTSLVYVELAAAQRLFGLEDKVSGIAVQVDNVYQARAVGEQIQQLLGYPFWSRDWMDMNRNLFSALKLERVTMFVILMLIILVAAFNIISTLFMVVMEKHKDIAILKALGMPSRRIMRIFIWEGMIVGLVGTSMGLLAGIGICYLLKTYHFINLPSDIYYITTLPVNLKPFYVFLICLVSLVISFLATIFPSYRASKMLPAEALRYE
ncbi:MAG: lipoprotein-releasing ABC transporter permease subunit [Deltaproteobacteria bacterium]|nr:lipoprotein-releasing ABC transporter permease subunit [Candidatus Anaeroferrophillus wilburensis]MBN2889745.1 lipoprotein-releasing ABC transporter permease subunit [Deltaproteobacteria bacterium]